MENSLRWKHVRDTSIRKAGEATWGMKKSILKQKKQQNSGEECAGLQQKKPQWKDKEAREVTLQGLSPLLQTLSLEGSPVDLY